MRGSKNKFVIHFSKASDLGIDEIGLKASNLSKLLAKRMPIPNGFIIRPELVDAFFEENHLDEFIVKEVSDIDPADSIKLENASKKIRNSIIKMSLNKDLKKVLTKAYSSLSGFTDAYVAIRSSSLIKDEGDDSFGGQYSTYLNIRGKDDYVEKIKYCWASLYSPQNIFYILSKGYDISKVRMGVIVQKMVQAEVSGILFTINPIDNDDRKMSIECILGLGEPIVKGELNPDTYIIDKETKEIVEKKIVPQDWMLVRKGRAKKGEDPNVKVKVSEVWKVRQKLENKYIEKLLKIGKKIEEFFSEPQEIEWAYEGGRIWIVQARPITTLKIENESWKKTPTFAALKAKVEGDEKKDMDKEKNYKDDVKVEKEEKSREMKEEIKDEVKEILTGDTTSNGVITGVVRIVKSTKDLKKLSGKSIVVAPRITPEFEGKISDALAIIVDFKNRDIYETIMAKSMGIPCIVDANIATKVLRNGEVITVDGNTGQIFSGATEEGLKNAEKKLNKGKEKEKKVKKSKKKKNEKSGDISGKSEDIIKTATKVFTIIDDPNEAPDLSRENIDGVANFRISEQLKNIGHHIEIILKSKKEKEEYIKKLSLGLFRVARSFDPRPVIFELSNLSAKEYKNLKGGKDREVNEDNPILGYRGASRFIENPEELEFELELVRNIRNKENIKNVWISIPYVRTYSELKEIKKMISSFGFRRSSTMKLFLKVQMPSVVVRIDKILKIGIDGVVLDLDILSQLFLGIDKENPKLSETYKQTHKSVLWSVEKVIKACNKKNVHTQVCGQSIASNPSLIEKLIEYGTISLVTDSESVKEVRKVISEAENSKLVKKR